MSGGDERAAAGSVPGGDERPAVGSAAGDKRPTVAAAAEEPVVAGEVIELERLIAMANQIGDFFAPYPPERAREGLRNHLRTYWDPRMRSALLAHVDAGGEGLDAGVIEGARLLRESAAEKSGYYGPPQA